VRALEEVLAMPARLRDHQRTQALRQVPLVAEIKALLVAGGSVAGSFALAWLLIRRVHVADRVL
jgi:hypothetical protein